MAHLWILGAGGWGAQKLDGAQFDLAAMPNIKARDTRPDVEGDARPAAKCGKVTRLVRVDAGGSRVWALIASQNSDVRVNGRAAPAGLCVLADRDEIRNGGEVQYFSTETLAAVEAFPGTDRAVFCGRCRQQIEVGSPSVCCPGCGVWYNQSADLPCWTYTETCVFCPTPTALDAGFAWTPEED
jgi:hypothetical protein